MPHAVIPSADTEDVASYSNALQALLRAAKRVKPTDTIEPPLTYADLADDIRSVLPEIESTASRDGHPQYAALETAFRTTFYDLVASTAIDDPAFSEIWNLLDLALIFGDPEWCEPALVFWLAEETLESQTIEGCERVFDYLDSRRERMIAKHWKAKWLILLRACTDLLRRLSRAEDTVFCGRVFIYLFQSFPLGDKSAVNLRGEYHVENVTIYDAQPPSPAIAASPSPMEVDKIDGEAQGGASGQETPVIKTEAPVIKTEAEGEGTNEKDEAQGSDVKAASAPDTPRILSTDELYPIFWSLQEFFAKPTTLFDPKNLDSFKSGLEATLAKFTEIQREQDTRGGVKSQQDEDAARHGAKRKHDEIEAEASASTYNPKYLTNRDLFELEISDLAFRRHVLVQALILTEFLLGQTPQARARLAQQKNKSVLYEFELDEAATAWALKTRAAIAGYLQAGAEGKFYYRMVDTVLGRDRNWVHWKAASCPPFQRPSVAPAALLARQELAARASAPRRVRATPLTAVDIAFLAETDGVADLVHLKDPARCAVPPLADFERPIADADFDLDMETDATKKEDAEEVRRSEVWRALRVACRANMAVLGPVDDGANVGALFRDPAPPASSPDGVADVAADTAADGGVDEGLAGARTAEAGDGAQLQSAQMEGTTDGQEVRADDATAVQAEGPAAEAAVASDPAK